jgi:cell division protease FtsH
VKTKEQLNFWYVVLAILAVLFIQGLIEQWRTVAAIPYSRFVALVEQRQVDDLVIDSDTVTGRLLQPVDGRERFVTVRVDPALTEALDEAGIEYSGRLEGGLVSTLLSWVVPALVFVGIWFLFFRRFAERQGFGGLMSIGKSKAKVYVEKETGVTFAEVAGVDEAKRELREIVDFLKDTKGYGVLGARVPKGVLLVGPPGTGKTLLARAVAGEAGVPFFSISGSEFVEMFVGVGAARVRDLFEQARKAAPAIIFVDELDALGRARGVGPQAGGQDEREQTLNQLLAELDGFDPSVGIVLLAATNRPEILDPALLRAGRFDRQVLVDRPDRTGRVEILSVHLARIKAAADLDVDAIAAMTPGFSGADLANLVNEAALLATRRRADAVAMTDFTEAVERIVAGLEKRNRLINPREREVVAHHEMGHALAARLLPGVDPVHKVSIIPRGVGALGYTIQRPTEERFLMTRAELEDKIVVLMAGRAAEKLVFGEVSTGAADDLVRATEIARAIVARYGMGDALGQVSLDPERPSFLGQAPEPGPGSRRYSERTAERIDEAVRAIVERCYERALELLETNRSALERGAAELLRRETLGEEDLARIVDQRGTPVAA